MPAFGATAVINPLANMKSREENSKRAAQQDALRQTAAEIFKDVKIGQTIEKKGIYIGLFEVSPNPSSLKIYGLYAAPEDLTDSFRNKKLAFNNASIEIASLRNWHGHDGSYFASSAEVFAALKFGRHRNHINYMTYKGQWFVPPLEFLRGVDSKGNKVHPNNLYDHRNTGDFKGTFTTSKDNAGGDKYMSSTEPLDRNSRGTIFVHFSDGLWGYGKAANTSLASINCRLCRAEEITLTL
jgi:hypothetical protein